ncbi:exopolysaccharide transport family protein [Mucilaginibacter glaciei]|uniref:AAA family ATPase n=1 Tax=Mucilaginibacter glaciei TaxID=2772109 RepID=A0A926NGW3_9SPHI|nr:AAA family ATPase [Mucilaginibacter glaciei]MBD1391859.1 AAA family ATPase [Mucilaginibacter glaciei]
MELGNFFKVLWKHKTLLIIIPLVTIIVSYFLVKNLPDQYVSSAQIATGIVDESSHLLDLDPTGMAQDQQLNHKFSNLIEIMKLKKLINQISYKLLIHDLTDPLPFRKPSKLMSTLNDGAKKNALKILQEKEAKLEPLSFYNKDENGLNELLRSMKYDERNIRLDLSIARDEDSDFISVSFESENAMLSAFVVNVLSSEFINYYTHTIKKNENDAVDYLTKLVSDKRDSLNSKTNGLRLYKIKNGILNLEDQSKSIFEKTVDYQDRKVQAERELASNLGAIKSINEKFDPKDRQYVEASVSKYNQAVTVTQEQLHMLTDRFVRSNFNPRYKASIDSLKARLAQQLDQTSDKYITNPLAGKDELVRQKTQLEINRDLAKYGIASINKALTELNADYNRLVPFDATVKKFEFEIEIASKEYTDALTRYNETNLRSTNSIKVRLVEKATPDAAEPSKKMLLIILGGVVSLVFCVIVLFAIFFFDDTIKEPAQLVNATGLPLLGYLNTISGGSLDLRKLWDVEHREKMKQFKELIRSIRFEIDQELRGEKVLAVTSLENHEGKTVLAISLAYSYSMINKKVLLIDGNFLNPTISQTAQPKLFVEEYFKNNPDNYDTLSSTINVMGNHGEDITLLEVSDENFIRSRFNELKVKYDIIIIETPPLSSLNKSKEWLLFANKILAVYESNKGIKKSQKADLKYLKNLNGKFSGWILNKANVKDRF